MKGRMAMLRRKAGSRDIESHFRQRSSTRYEVTFR